MILRLAIQTFCFRALLLLTDERRLLRGREALPDGHEEDGHGQQRGDTQRHLLPGLGRHVEHQQRWSNREREVMEWMNT